MQATLKNLDGCKDNPNFKFVKMDIRDRENINKLFEEEKFDIVVNFAAESHVDRWIEDPEVFLRTNIIGTEVLMDAAQSMALRDIIRFQQMKSMEIFLWKLLIPSLRRRHRFTRALRILLPRPAPTYWLWHITGLLV